MKPSSLPLAFVALLLVFQTNGGYAADSTFSSCQQDGFKNAYYLIDIQDVAPVSRFYRDMSDNSLKDLQEYSTNTGQTYIAVKGKRQRVSRYFDFDNLALLEANRELVLHVDENLPEYRLEREFAVYRDNLNPSSNTRYEIRNYNKQVAALDKHAFFSKIKRRERAGLINILSEVSAEAVETISEKIKINSDELVYLVTHFGISQGSITFSNFNITDYGIPSTHALLKLELNRENLKKLSDDEQRYLNQLFCQTQFELHQALPHIQKRDWFGYSDYQVLAEQALPGRNLLKQHPLLYSFGQILILSIIGFLILTLLLGRYEKENNYKGLLFSRFDKKNDP